MGNTVEKGLTAAGKQAKAAVHDMKCVYRDFRKHHCGKNALMVRKKFAMKDVCFRRDCPETEVFRWELAFDVEMYVLLLLLAGAGVWCAWHLSRWRRTHRRMRETE